MSLPPRSEKSESTRAKVCAQLYPTGVLPLDASDNAAELAASLIRYVDLAGDVLPAASSPLRQLGVQLYRENVALDRCTEIISADPALAHLVLRAANLAALGSRTFTVPYAVMFLGLARLRLLFGVEVLRRMNTDRLKGVWTRLWERNLFAARFVERLASAYHPVDGTEYLAGLLHDAAWPALVGFFKQEYGVFFDEPDHLFPMDGEVFATSHAAISAAICVRSGLPGHVVEAVARHHGASLPDPAAVRAAGGPRYHGGFLAALLRVADLTADASGYATYGGAPAAETIAEVAASPEAIWLRSFGPLPDLAA
ncbi:MAG TPA: HDOD domain-containing protein, partial [Candidatus Methylacidiphilales bacterium]